MAALAIRPLRPDDRPTAAQVFFDAVRERTPSHDTEAQRRAWAGEAPDPEGWRDRLEGMDGFAAEEEDRLVGLMTIDRTGFIGLAFVAHTALGRGVGSQLHRAFEARARELGAAVLTTEASRMARPFSERQGWSVMAEHTVVKHGVELTNHRMRKTLWDAPNVRFAVRVRQATIMDADAISQVVVAALRETNAADHPPEVIDSVAAMYDRLSSVMARCHSREPRGRKCSESPSASRSRVEELLLWSTAGPSCPSAARSK